MNEQLLQRRFGKLSLSEYVLTAMVLTYSIIFSYYSILRHYSFRSNCWDLGIAVQSLATAVRGELFRNNAELYYSSTGSYFGVHFSPILFVVLPFFLLIPKAETVLVVQSVILALGAIPIYLISKHCLESELCSLLLSGSYLLSPTLQGINWYDFHTQAFFPLFILSATYFLKKRKVWLFYLFVLMALMTMEQASYLVAVYIIYVAWETREEVRKSFIQRKLIPEATPALATLMLTIGWLVFSSAMISWINPNPPVELKALHNYRILDVESTAEIPFKAIMNPDIGLKAIQFDLFRKVTYVLLTFAPSCYIALLQPITVLPALLWLFLAVLSNHAPYYELGFQYTAFTVPFVSVATVETIRILSGSPTQKEGRRVAYRISTLIMVTGIILALLASPLSSLYRPGDFQYFRDYGISEPSNLDKAVMELVGSIPEGKTIITTSTNFPHLATNPGAFTIPPLDAPTQRLFKGILNYLKNMRFDYVLLTYFWDRDESKLLYSNLIEQNSIYGLLVKGPGLELYMKNYEGSPTNLPLRFSYKEMYSTDSVLHEDTSSMSGRVYSLRPSPLSGRTVVYGPYITLLQGDYVAKFRLKIDNPINEKVVRLEVWSHALGTRLASYDFYGSDFVAPNLWNTFSVSFSLLSRSHDIEFRVLALSEEAGITFDYLEITPLPINSGYYR